MIWPDPPADGSASAFLVERYISPAEALDLAGRTANVDRVCTGTQRTRAPVRYLGSAYLPTEDTCFCLFRAVSAEAVETVNRDARFALDRIIHAVLLPRRPAPAPDHGDRHDQS